MIDTMELAKLMLMGVAPLADAKPGYVSQVRQSLGGVDMYSASGERVGQLKQGLTGVDVYDNQFNKLGTWQETASGQQQFIDTNMEVGGHLTSSAGEHVLQSPTFETVGGISQGAGETMVVTDSVGDSVGTISPVGDAIVGSPTGAFDHLSLATSPLMNSGWQPPPVADFPTYDASALEAGADLDLDGFGDIF